MNEQPSTRPGTPSPEQVERELRAINLLAHQSGWDRYPSLYVIQAYTLDPTAEVPPMSLETVKVPVDDEMWTNLGGGDPVAGLYIFAKGIMGSFMGGMGFPNNILHPMIRHLPVATVFLNENYKATPEAVATLNPGQRIGELPEDMREEQRSLHGIDNQGMVFSLNHIRSDLAQEQEIVFEHQVNLNPAARGLGRASICLKMILDAVEAHFIMGEQGRIVDHIHHIR